MKGKGKTSISNQFSNKDVDDDRWFLHFPDLNAVDHVRLCPRYTSVLARNEEELIGLEELDTLQVELEILLASTAKRMKLLDEEKITLCQFPDKGDIKLKSPQKSKKLKRTINNSNSINHGKKSKIDLSNKFEELSNGDHCAIVHPLPQKETPIKFWKAVEKYCGEINTDHLKILEDILRSLTDNLEFFKIPNLGKHFSEKWVTDIVDKDLSNIEDEIPLRNKEFHPDFKIPEDREPDTLVHSLHNSEDISYQNITKLLVQPLIDDPETLAILNVPLKDDIDLSEAPSVTTKGLASQVNINMGSALSLEGKIKRDILKQNFLKKEKLCMGNGVNGHTDTTNAIRKRDVEDEILEELKEKQEELRNLTETTLKQTEKLYNLSKTQIQIQELKNKVAVCDENVIESYNKVLHLRLKRKSPIKKEKESITKLLKQHKTIKTNLKEVKELFQKTKKEETTVDNFHKMKELINGVVE